MKHIDIGGNSLNVGDIVFSGNYRYKIQEFIDTDYRFRVVLEDIKTKQLCIKSSSEVIKTILV